MSRISTTLNFTAGIPLVDVSTNNWQSQYIYLETTGYVDDLRIDFGDSETLYPFVLIETRSRSTR